jgi:hypothetical protein
LDTQENKRKAESAYAAFSSGDAEAAMRAMDDSIEWTVTGDNALTGTYKGKQAVGEVWGKLASKGFRAEPQDCRFLEPDQSPPGHDRRADRPLHAEAVGRLPRARSAERCGHVGRRVQAGLCCR